MQNRPGKEMNFWQAYYKGSIATAKFAFYFFGAVAFLKYILR